MRTWTVKQDVTLTRATGDAGFTNEQLLTKLARKGTITRVVIRESNEALHFWGDTATVFISDTEDTAIDANTPDEDICYRNAGVVLAESATVASDDDNVNLDGGASYDTAGGGPPRITANILTGTAGDETELFVTVYARVEA